MREKRRDQNDIAKVAGKYGVAGSAGFLLSGLSGAVGMITLYFLGRQLL